MRTERIGRPLITLRTCSSTNDVAAEFAAKGADHGLTVVSDEQASGRGRLGRRWISPPGGIWITILLRGSGILRAANCLALIGALAIARALESDLAISARVRWPNDVVVEGHKLAGVLVEAKSKGNQIEYALLGMGINANFHISAIAELSETSTTLLDLVGSPVDREAIICSILWQIEHLCELLDSNDQKALIDLIERSESSRGRSVVVRLQDTEIVGVFDGYEGLTKVRILTREGAIRMIDTGTVVSVHYSNT